ncbi:tenascin-like [Thunnus thynnus]|uniref:tenascin-like n=1 Tax=Thunnus thynnus TaxID=8237 RepID=UPI0035282DB7
MLPTFPSLLLLLLLAGPALLTSTSQQLQVRGQRTPRDTKEDAIKVVISEGCTTHGESSDVSQGGKEIDLVPGSPLVLTHKIKLVPSGSGFGSRPGSCGCEADFAALRERLERLEREVSSLREKCGGAEGGCCTSKESKGAGCSIKPKIDECPNECSDQGRCVDGKCVCFPGFSGLDCSDSNCPGNCNNNGKCVNGQCVCDPGFTGPKCLQRSCPDNCNNQGRCVNGKCVCDSGFTGPSCSDKSCPGNCNNKGRCVNGQCVCNPGFTSPDCSKKACPNNCNDRGRCVNGKCVCNSGFTGADCSEISCPGNCNNKGRCVNGQCVCDDGFTGSDCSERTCPNDCNNRGRCVNGKCVCDSGFTGDDCSEKSCPGNCNNKGRCVNGQCVCDDGFAGQDCSEKACPNNCSNRGKCVNGKCVCDVGFAGPDCAAKACPNNCNNKGRCVKGKCVCRRGFTGPDCSQCEEGMTGPNCDTVMSGVSQLSTKAITDTSVTLLWTPPPIQYDAYHITFTSQKESDQQITVQVEGSLTTFTQTGLAAGQEYTVSITGEINGRRGAKSSTEFTTLISGPTKLQIVKTTSTSAVVQWEQSQGEIDRYRMTVSPNDGAGRSQEMTFPPGRDSAHIQQLEAGRLYDIILVAEKGSSQSEPATTQTVPGNTLPKVTMAAVTTQVTPAPGQELGDRDKELNPERQVFDQQGRKEDGSEADSVKVRGVPGHNKDPSATVIAKTKPLVSRKDGAKLKLAERPVFSRKPNAPNFLRFNATRVVPGGRRVGPGTKTPVWEKKVPFVAKKPKPGAPTVGDRTQEETALTMRDPSVEASSTERREDKNPAIISWTDSGTNTEDLTVPVGSKNPPDVGTAVQGSNADPGSSEPTGAGQSHEKKCMNKIKVTHIRLPHKTDRGSGCRGDGTVLEGKTTSDSHQGSSETDDTPLKNNFDLKPLSTETELNYSPDPLHKLLTDTFDSLNITTFSVHLSKPADLSDDAATVRKQILGGLKPLSSFSSSPSASSPSQSSSSPHSSVSKSSSHPSTSQSSSSSVESTSLTSSSTSSPSPSSSSSSNSEISDPVESNEEDVATDKSTKSTTGAVSPEDPKVPFRVGSIPVFRRTPPKGGFMRRPQPNMGPSQNRTRPNLKVPYYSSSPLNLIPTRETETTHTPTSELSLSPSSSASEESSAVEVNAPVSDTSADKDKATTIISSGAEQNQKKTPTEGGRLPVRRLPPKGGYLHRPLSNVGPFQNQTRPNTRVRARPFRPINPAKEINTEPISSTESPASSSHPSSPKEKSYPAEGTGTGVEDTEGRVRASLPTKFSQTRTNGVPSSDHPTSKVSFSRRPNLYVGPFRNRTRTNLRPPQPPHRSPMSKHFPKRKPNGSSSIAVGSQTIQSEKKNTPEFPDNQSGQQGYNNPTQEVQIRQFGDQDTAGEIHMGGHDTTVRPQTNQLEKGDNDLIQTSQSGEEETQTPESNSDSGIQKERVNAAKTTGTTIQGRPIIKQTSSDSRASRPVTLPKRQPPTRRITAKMRNIGGSQRGEDPKTNHTAKLEFDSKTDQTTGSNSKSPTGSDVSSSGVTREPLNHVRVTDRTSDRFTVIWDAPEGKYKNFVVTKKEAGKDEEPKEKESRKKQEQEDSEKEDGKEDKERTNKPTKETEADNRNTEDENRVSESVSTQVPTIQNIKGVKPATESDETFKKVLPGSARSFQFEDLSPQTEYTVTLLGKGPGLLSRLHKLVISTGPEPPSNIIFSKVTENSLTVSWTKPKRPVSGFKVTYTHTKEGEPVSVSVDSSNSSLGLSQLSPGSSYEVNVISILGLDESDPVKDSVMTLPDPATNLQAVNITDTKALLLWRPALAAIDKYAIVYGSGKDAALRITVSGNAAEQQLSGLEESTTYTVTITSELGSLQSPAATTSFTTTSGSGKLRDLQASQVTPRTALLSWKPPSKPVGSYRLTYQTESQEMKEVIVDATVTEYNLTRLDPGSKYTVQLQAEGGEGSTISTDFTTGTMQFPFPSDCSQELMNGIRTSGVVEIFPQGKLGTPMKVYCDMETDGGGWTVFQRRKDGSVDFFRGWKDYVKGFGDLSGEFWMGLDSIHNLTATTRMSLRVDLRDGHESVFAKYSTFEVAKRNYRLTVGGYSGTAGDSLSYHNSRIFSTKDRDSAPFITRCAMSYRGGWWYKNCHEANLNGLYGIDVKHQGVIWTTWKGKDFSIPFTEMKMRPAAFSPPTRG